MNDPETKPAPIGMLLMLTCENCEGDMVCHIKAEWCDCGFPHMVPVEKGLNPIETRLVEIWATQHVGPFNSEILAAAPWFLLSPSLN